MKIIFTPAGGVTIYVDVTGVNYANGSYTATARVDYADSTFSPGGLGQNTLAIPSEAITVDAETTLEEAVMAWLVSEDGPYTGGQIVEDAEFAFLSLRLAMKQAVKTKRSTAEQAGLTVAGIGSFDTDVESQRKINGAVTMALIALQSNQPFDLDWRLADDSVVSLDAMEMIGVGVAVGQHVSACQANKNALDAAIALATTVEELQAIDTDAGWPA